MEATLLEYGARVFSSAVVDAGATSGADDAAAAAAGGKTKSAASALAAKLGMQLSYFHQVLIGYFEFSSSIQYSDSRQSCCSLNQFLHEINPLYLFKAVNFSIILRQAALWAGRRRARRKKRAKPLLSLMKRCDPVWFDHSVDAIENRCLFSSLSLSLNFKSLSHFHFSPSSGEEASGEGGRATVGGGVRRARLGFADRQPGVDASR